MLRFSGCLFIFRRPNGHKCWGTIVLSAQILQKEAIDKYLDKYIFTCLNNTSDEVAVANDSVLFVLSFEAVM